MAQKHLFEHPKWSRNNFGKNLFFALGTVVDPPLAPTVRGLAGPPAVKPVRTPVAIFGSLGVCIYVPASRHWLISYSPIHLA